MARVYLTSTATGNPLNQTTLYSLNAQSKAISYNNGAINFAKITLTYTGNAPDNIYLTADGVNWESVTNGTLHTFTNTGTDLRWKVDASGTTITKIIIEDY